MPRIFSGIQPSGELHIGNWLGAVQNWAKLQYNYESIICVVDLHAITQKYDHASLTQRTREMAIGLLACGIDPDRATLFVQSHVPEHTELQWLLNAVTPIGELERMTQFKDKSQRLESVPVGLLTYPVLMAADILLYQSDQVPVGEDQRQHLELTRDLAARFNSRYGEAFVVPEPYILPSVGRIADLAEPGTKMSKSLSSPTGIIELLDDPAINIRKIKSAVTDSGREIIFDEADKPGVSNLLTILAALTDTSVDSLVEEFAGRGYGDLKGAVADAVTAFATPYRNRTLELLEERGELESLLAKGADRAREVASATLADVYAKVGVA
jgi:tryptophanyl-tRNA synthetase